MGVPVFYRSRNAQSALEDVGHKRGAGGDVAETMFAGSILPQKRVARWTSAEWRALRYIGGRSMPSTSNVHYRL